MSSFSQQTWRCPISHQHPLPSFQLTATEVTSLLQLREARRTPQGVAKRAQIVLTAHDHPDWSSQQLAQLLGLNARLIRKWRRRWFETHSLQDASRSGGPGHFSSEVRAQVTALACSLPRSSGVPLAHWSRAELARYVAATSSLPEISASTIAFQHIQDVEAFLLRARPVLPLYEHATTLLGACGSGSSGPTRKPRSRRGRLSKPLAQLFVSTPCINLHAIIGREHCT